MTVLLVLFRLLLIAGSFFFFNWFVGINSHWLHGASLPTYVGGFLGWLLLFVTGFVPNKHMLMWGKVVVFCTLFALFVGSFIYLGFFFAFMMGPMLSKGMEPPFAYQISLFIAALFVMLGLLGRNRIPAFFFGE